VTSELEKIIRKSPRGTCVLSCVIVQVIVGRLMCIFYITLFVLIDFFSNSNECMHMNKVKATIKPLSFCEIFPLCYISLPCSRHISMKWHANQSAFKARKDTTSQTPIVRKRKPSFMNTIMTFSDIFFFLRETRER
jgi:hypothetical protein